MTYMRAPTTPVICSGCGRELRGSECADGFLVRHHRDPLSERRCLGVFRVDHQPVVVFHCDMLGASRVDSIAQRFADFVRASVR